MKKALLAVLAVLCISSVSYGQLKQGAWGITADITGSNSLGVAYAMMSNIRLGVNLGFSTAGPSDGKTTGFLIGAGGWYYLGTTDNVSAFAGGGLSFNSQSISTTTPTLDPITGLPTGGTTSSSQSTSTFGVAGQFGAEYWFSQKFSAHGFLQFMLTTATGSGLSIGTTTGTGLTWYF